MCNFFRSKHYAITVEEEKHDKQTSCLFWIFFPMCLSKPLSDNRALRGYVQLGGSWTGGLLRAVDWWMGT